jgi:anti-anti-sigma factor
VCDSGLWRPPPADRGYRGRGLELISALATDVEVVHVPEVAGTIVRFRVAPAVPGGPGVRPQHGTAGAPLDGGAVVSVHDEPGGPRLEVHGEVDLATAGRVRRQVLTRLEQLAPGSVATLDLGPTGYLASAGVGLVLEAVARARRAGVELRVRTRPGTPPARILALAGAGEPVAEAPTAPLA